MSYIISYETEPSHEDTKILWLGICKQAKLKKGFAPGKPFAFFIKDELNQIKGGCSGYLYYGCLYVDLLWTDETLRAQGYGTKLMVLAEELAQKNKCHFVAVNTMDFEALGFYKKLNYFVEFERSGFDKQSVMHFLRKDLSS